MSGSEDRHNIMKLHIPVNGEGDNHHQYHPHPDFQGKTGATTVPWDIYLIDGISSNI